MKPPSLEEVDAYCLTHHPEVDAIEFWNFYQSKNWMLGKNKITNWHCCVATWARRIEQRTGTRDCKRHPDSGRTLWGTCWGCYAEKNSPKLQPGFFD